MPFQFRWLGTAATNSCNENSHMSKKDKANLDDDKHGQKKQLGRYSFVIQALKKYWKDV